MSLFCCFTFKDNPTGHRWVSVFHSIFNKVKGVLHGNEGRLIHWTQPRAAYVNVGVTTDTSATNSCHVDPNVEQNPPGVAMILDKTAASVNVEATTDVLNTNSSRVHPNVDSRQSSEQNLSRVAMTLDKPAGTLSKEGVLQTQTEVESCNKEASDNLEKSLITKAQSIFYEEFPSPDDEDVCPTCLEEYEPENPKIVAECSHHFHLSCIYDWMERSDKCPICFRMMVFSEN